MFQAQPAKDADCPGLGSPHRNQQEAHLQTASGLRSQRNSPSSSSSSSSLSFPIFISAKAHAGEDRRVIDGLKGYQSAIEQNHNSTGLQVLPATGGEKVSLESPK